MRIFLAVVFTALILASCASTMNINKPESAVVNPKGLPKEQLAKIVIDPKIVLYAVDGEQYNLNLFGSGDTILVASGVHTIEILIHGEMGYATQRFPMQIAVESEKKYVLKSSVSDTKASAALIDWEEQVK